MMTMLGNLGARSMEVEESGALCSNPRAHTFWRTTHARLVRRTTLHCRASDETRLVA